MDGYRPFLRLAFIGYGKLARAFIGVLHQKLHTLPFTPLVTGIITRHGVFWPSREGFSTKEILRDLPKSRRATGGVSSFLKRVKTDIIIELTPLSIKDGLPAAKHLQQALSQQIHVVTANAGPIAFQFGNLHEIAYQNNCHLRFESAVAGGLPIFTLKRHALPTAQVRHIRAMLNATTNHVLQRMAEGMPSINAISEAQAAGYSTYSPKLDLDGWVGAIKATILGSVLMQPVEFNVISRDSFDARAGEILKRAEKHHAKVRQIISLELQKNNIEASVRLAVIPPNDPFFHLSPTSQAITVQNDLNNTLTLMSDGLPTQQAAASLLSDLLNIYYLSINPQSVPGLFDIKQDQMVAANLE